MNTENYAALLNDDGILENFINSIINVLDNVVKAKKTVFDSCCSPETIASEQKKALDTIEFLFLYYYPDGGKKLFALYKQKNHDIIKAYNKYRVKQL